MFKSSSEPRLTLGVFAALVGLVIVSLAFFPLQNAGVLPGGAVAPIKVAWLASAIIFWYVLPGFLLIDARVGAAAKRAVTVLLVSMLIRAVVELYMMYVSGNWSPWLGIGHNVLTFSLLLVALITGYRTIEKLYWVYLAIAAAMFVPESGFAWYMFVHVGEPGSAVYFVPDSVDHRHIMILTYVCVIALAAYLSYFLRYWLYGQSKR